MEHVENFKIITSKNGVKFCLGYILASTLRQTLCLNLFLNTKCNSLQRNWSHVPSIATRTMLPHSLCAQLRLPGVEMNRDCQKKSLFNRLEVHLMHLVWTLRLHMSLRQERQAGTFVHHSWSHPLLAAICIVSAKQCENRANRGWSALKDVVMRVSRCDSAAVRNCEVMVLHLLDFRGLRHFILGTGVA